MKRTTFRNLVVSTLILAGTFYLTKAYLKPKKKVVEKPNDEFSNRTYHLIGEVKKSKPNVKVLEREAM